jgi:outer membrane protein
MTHRRSLLFFVCVLFLMNGPAQAAQGGSTSAPQSAGSLVMPRPLSSPIASPSSVGSNSAAAQRNAGPATTGMPISPQAEVTLKQAIAIALKYHPRIRESAENTTAATARIGEARSYLGPQVNGIAQDLGTSDNGIADTSFYNPSGMFPRVSGRNHSLPSSDFDQTGDINNNYMGGLAISQFLFDFGGRRGFVEQRRFEAASVAATEQLTKLDLIFEVSQTYFSVLQAKELIGVYEKAVEQRQFHLHEAQVKAEARLRPELDVYATQAELERARLHLVDAHNAYDDAKVALNNALGLSDRAPQYHLADVLTYAPVTESLQALLATAMHQRPDLKALDDQARALGAQIVEYRSDYFPNANALGGYSAMGTGPAMGYRLPVANNFNVGIVITWPIFNSFLTTDQISETKARQRAVQDAIADLQQRVILQVQTAFLDRRAALQRIERAEKALAASRAQLELAEKRYQAGLTNIVELEDAQRYYTNDDAEYASALYGFSVANAAVDAATGRSLSRF